MREIILGFFVIIILFGASGTYAQCACAYAGESEADEAKRSDAAFIGEVTEIKSIESNKDSEYKHYEVTFKVKKSLKDDSIKIITVRNITSGNSDFEEKESYLVFAVNHKDYTLLAGIYCCTHTKRISGATKANKKLTCISTESRALQWT